MIKSSTLAKLTGLKHAFFTREGGVSQGIYQGLNTGLGSSDARQDILENRRIARVQLAADDLMTPYQIHSNIAIIADGPVTSDEVPRADAIVTSRPGLMIAVNTADCTPVLFADAQARVIAVAHAGWKGAITGVLEAAIARMEELGARRSNIQAAVGPTISQSNYEVGPEFIERFMEQDKTHNRFFLPSQKSHHYMFDLPAYVGFRLQTAGIDGIEDTGLCTYADEARFFSYRRTTHRQEADYGRQLTGIVLTPEGG